MFDFDDTEAAHLSEIYDGAEIFEPYTKTEREEYKRRKSIFPSSSKGKYVIIQKPRFSTVKKLFLVDRKKSKRFWWSHDANYAMLFEKESAAKIQAAKLRFNNIKVIQIGKQ